MVQQKWQRDRLAELWPSLCTQDDLLPISQLIVQKDGILLLKCNPEVQVQPHWRVEKAARRILERQDLWTKASIRVQVGKSIVWRAFVRGVPFQRAVDIALQEREHISGFWIPNQDPDQLYSTLLTRLRRRKEASMLALEAWQWIGHGIEVNYVHAIMTSDATEVSHLDGAIVSFSSEEDARTLFWTGEKTKGVNYEKYFRVDANTEAKQSGTTVGQSSL